MKTQETEPVILTFDIKCDIYNALAEVLFRYNMNIDIEDPTEDEVQEALDDFMERFYQA